MSIIDTYDKSQDSILSPEHLAKPIDGFPEVIIVTFSHYMLNALLQHYTCTTVCTTSDGSKIYKTNYQGKSIAFFQVPIGAPSTVFFLEKALIRGAKKILLFGSCGTLDNKLTDNNIIVPTHAYRDEGTSYHYASADNGDFIEVKSSARTAEILKEMGIPIVLGKTWTTDAIFRETRKNMELRKAAGCIVVEMECAAVMAMAQFRGVEAYQFLYAGDNLDADEWEKKTLGNLPTDAKERLTKIALEVAVRI